MKEEVKNFVIEKIEELAILFPEISFKYGYDTISGQHIVDIEPNTQYYNEKYMLAEYDVVSLFSQKFPTDQLLFISNDKFIKVTNPIYTKCNAKVELAKSITSIKPSNLIFAPFDLSGFIIEYNNYELLIKGNLIGNGSNNIVIIPSEEDISSGDNSYAAAA
jgi:hypothetical protein